MSIPDFLVVGHVAKDADANGWRLGGTVAYAATQACRLGLTAAIVTRASRDVDLTHLLPGVRVHCIPSETTTTFENRYDGSRRIQRVWSQAPAIGPEDVPQELRGARIVLLGPLLSEVTPDMAGLFAGSLVGCCLQGWLRDVGDDGLVRRRAWPQGVSLRGVDIAFVSEEDMEDDEEALNGWQREAQTVVVTCGSGGATVWMEGKSRRIAAFPHAEVDPTGAGDVFAAAFMVAYDETRDVAAAARFADAAAGLSIEGAGTSKAPTREQVHQVLAEHQEIVLA
jgi:sugar/nucleoside kinase (ribokinase family)